MLEGKLIIIPALGRQNKGKSSFTGSGLFVLMSECGNNNELALQHGGFCSTWSLVAKGLTAIILTHSSAVPTFMRSNPLFQPVSPYRVRNLTKLCNIQILWSTAGHSWRALTRNRSLSTHWSERCRLSFAFWKKQTNKQTSEIWWQTFNGLQLHLRRK